MARKPPNLYFPSELRTLDHVPRWSIVACNRRQYVASHSYYVALYAYLIAKLIEWKGPREYLMLAALTHDLDEVFSGDVVGPAKKALFDQEKAGDFLEAHMHANFGPIVEDLIWHEGQLTVSVFEAAQCIVDAADRMDALFYLLWEQRMGNRIVDGLVPRGMAMFENSWRSLPSDEKSLSKLWQTEILPCIEDHKVNGGRGI